jgi:hypothetical protein
LAVLVAKLKTISNRPAAGLRDILRLFQPETVLKWHRALVRRKWTYRAAKVGGRPRTDKTIEVLVVQFARENTDWGYGKIAGVLGKLGYEVSDKGQAAAGHRDTQQPYPQNDPQPPWEPTRRFLRQCPPSFFVPKPVLPKALNANIPPKRLAHPVKVAEEAWAAMNVTRACLKPICYSWMVTEPPGNAYTYHIPDFISLCTLLK